MSALAVTSSSFLELVMLSTIIPFLSSPTLMLLLNKSDILWTSLGWQEWTESTVSPRLSKTGMACDLWAPQIHVWVLLVPYIVFSLIRESSHLPRFY